MLYSQSVLLLLVSLAYLEKVPERYLCAYKNDEPGAELRDCSPKDFCDDPNLASFEPDTSHEDYLNNWIQKFDLTCASSVKISAIGTTFFASWLFTLLFLPRLADLHGRKILINAGVSISIFAYLAMLSTKSYWVLLASLFILGALSTVRVQVVLVYLYETMMKRHWNTAMFLM